MKQEKEKTKVLFLIEECNTESDKFPSGSVFAYFPDNIYSAKQRTNFCYSHIGQHSACHPDYANECQKATPDQYKDLKKELENIGYDLEILN